MRTSTGRLRTSPLASRCAAAATILNSVTAASPSPSTSFRRSGGAEITSANEPNFSSSILASGFTSRCGMARKRMSSSIS